MNLKHRLLASTLVSACLLITACGESDTSPAGTDHPAMTATTGSPGDWTTLSEQQQSVLSVLHTAWPSIPPKEQQRLLEGANRWMRMQPREQAAFKETWQPYLSSPGH